MNDDSPPSLGRCTLRQTGRGNRLFDDIPEEEMQGSGNRLSFPMADEDTTGKTPMKRRGGGPRNIQMRNPFDGYLSSEEDDTSDLSPSSGQENNPLASAFAPGTRNEEPRHKMTKRLQKMGAINTRRQHQPLPRRPFSGGGTSFDSDDMCVSPYMSPGSSSYMTMDGRCVTSQNPFSPMNTDEFTTKTYNIANGAAPSIPFSFDTEDTNSKHNSHQPVRPRLEKRDASASPAALMPRQFHSPPTMDTSTSSPDSPTANMMEGHKVRRLGREGDVHYPRQQQNLQVDTRGFYGKSALASMDEISPTDIFSFPPLPSTPSKSPRMAAMADTNLSTPPGTPQINRSGRCPPSGRPMSGHASRLRQDFSSSPPSSAAGGEATSRFRSDFDVIGELGKGTFGVVYKVLSRLDGCMYAMKVALRSAKGNGERNRMLKEVYALAALSDHADPATFHIVRYHQAFIEDNRLYIQTELCTWNLANEVEMANGRLSVDVRYKLLREMLLALEFIHKHDMVHLDIKPGNIFVKKDQPLLNVFKLGDFGLVTKMSNNNEIEEGDSRYMSMELLQENHQDLSKSDIFSLGATLYEICLGRPLPTNGDEWQAIRAGTLQPMIDTPPDMDTIVRQMMHPNFAERPSASDLLRRPQLLSKEQRQLILERNKIFQAKAALAQQVRELQKRSPPPLPPMGGMIRRNTWSGGSL